MWRVPSVDCDPPPPLPCPVHVVDGASCATDGCAAYPTECSYGDCRDLGGTYVAACDGKLWHVTRTTCPPPCVGLDFCACFARADCQYLTDTCICPCDYQCAGQPPCVCECGGGTYLGCMPR